MRWFEWALLMTTFLACSLQVNAEDTIAYLPPNPHEELNHQVRKEPVKETPVPTDFLENVTNDYYPSRSEEKYEYPEFVRDGNIFYRGYFKLAAREVRRQYKKVFKEEFKELSIEQDKSYGELREEKSFELSKQYRYVSYIQLLEWPYYYKGAMGDTEIPKRQIGKKEILFDSAGITVTNEGSFKFSYKTFFGSDEDIYKTSKYAFLTKEKYSVEVSATFKIKPVVNFEDNDKYFTCRVNIELLIINEYTKSPCISIALSAKATMKEIEAGIEATVLRF